MCRDCTVLKKQKGTNGSTYRFPIRAVGHGNTCDCYTGHLLDTLICQRSDSLYAQADKVIKATKAQDDFLFLEDVVSLPDFSSRKSFVTP